MATLSSADQQNLTADQQAQIKALKEQWAAANAAGDQAGMDAAHAAAEAIRKQAGYSGGTAGNSYVAATNGTSSKLSGADQSLLTAQQQSQIQALKQQWAAANAAGDSAAMDYYHQQAEAIRNQAGYSGGTSGTGYQALGAGSGGMTADQMRLWLEDYEATNYKDGRGWTNGYSAAMNVRSKANKIRQQMEANSKAWHTADAETQAYLHEQNLELAELLYEYTGQSRDNTWYNEDTGRWETYNGNVGYGYNVSYQQPNVGSAYKQYYGYTDEMMNDWAKDTSHYYNFVDVNAPARYQWDESKGYTGQYAQFANGPYLQLLEGSDPGITPLSAYDNSGVFQTIAAARPVYDENGNLVKQDWPLKNNNAMSDYTNQFTSYVQNGVILPGIVTAAHAGKDSNGAYTHVTDGYVDAEDPYYTGGVGRDMPLSTESDPNNILGQLQYYEE